MPVRVGVGRLEPATCAAGWVSYDDKAAGSDDDTGDDAGRRRARPADDFLATLGLAVEVEMTLVEADADAVVEPMV